MKQAQRRRGAWLAPIRILLVLMLTVDILAIPLMLLGLGAPEVGTVQVGKIFAGEPMVNRRFPMLHLGQVSVVILDPSLAQNILYTISRGLPFLLVSIPMIIFAMRVVEDARWGDPFTPAMVRRLRRLGLMVLVLGLLSEVVEYIARTVLLDMALPHDASLRLGASIERYPTLWWLLPGLVLLAISEVVKRGCDLRAELDEVI